MKYLIVMTFVVIFTLGWFTNDVYSSLSFEDTELPYQDSGIEKASPSDWVSENQIFIYDDQIVIKVENASWARYADTNSMDPVLDKDTNGIEIIPKTEDSLKVGDIIAYKADWTDGTVIHRIIEIEYDENGWYATTKGDNNKNADPSKVRFSQIRYVLIGLIY